MAEAQGAIYAANMAALAKRFPDLARQVESAPDDLTVIETTAQNGAPTLSVVDPQTGNEIGYHSQYDPAKAAAHEVERVDLARQHTWIVCGLGYGYHLVELIRRATGGYYLLGIERSWSVFRSALKRVDLTAVIANEHVFLFVGSNINSLSDWLFHTFGEMCVDDMELFKHGPSERIFFQFYNSIIPEVRRSVNRFEVNVVTAQAHGRKFQHNMMFNVVAALEAADAGNLFGAWAGKPAFVVAAGPSLDLNKHLLRHAAGKAMIIAVDSAYPALLDAGVRPDLVAVIDPIDRKKDIFQEMTSHGHTHLLLIQHAHPALGAAFGGPVFFSASAAPVATWMAQALGEYAFLGECLTVAHGAFFMALKMGADPVVFVGQDLAFSRDLAHSHAGGGRHSWGREVALRHERRSMVAVQGVDGQPVPTFRNLAAFIKTFEVEINNWRRDHPEVRFIDATEGGAYIGGTEALTLSEVIERFCVRDLDPAATLRAAWRPNPSEDRLERFRRLVDKTAERCRRLMEVCERGHKAAKRLEGVLAAAPLRQAEYLSCAAIIREANAEAFRDDVFIEFVGQTLVRTKILVKRFDLSIKHEANELQLQKTQAEKYVSVFKDFADAARWLVEELDLLGKRLADYARHRRGLAAAGNAVH